MQISTDIAGIAPSPRPMAVHHRGAIDRYSTRKIVLSSILAAILALNFTTSTSTAAAGALPYEDLFAKAQSEILNAQQMGISARFETRLLGDSKAAYAAGDKDKARKLAKKALRRAQTAQRFAAQQRWTERAF